MSLKTASLFCAPLVAVMLYGQEPVAPEAAAAAARRFLPSPLEKPLACEVRPLAPALSYRLVYHAGYSVTLPMGQFAGRESTLEVLLRVTPARAGAQPLLLKDAGKLPASSGGEKRDATKFEAQVQGGFYVGEGPYHAELVLTDSDKRVCRGQWDLELKPRKGVGTALAPGQLAPLFQLDWPTLETRSGSATILLHAGLPAGNPVLLASFAAILDRMPFRRFRAVVFSLDQHKELLRQNVGDAGGFRRVAEVLRDFNAATVPIQVLQDRAGHRDLLWHLLAKESVRAEPSDAVIFVGFSTFDDSHVFAPPACADGSRKALYVYLDFAPPGSRRIPPPGIGRGRARGPLAGDYPRAGAEMPDVLTRIARACGGRAFHIHSPEEFATALRKTAELLRGR